MMRLSASGIFFLAFFFAALTSCQQSEKSFSPRVPTEKVVATYRYAESQTTPENATCFALDESAEKSVDNAMVIGGAIFSAEDNKRGFWIHSLHSPRAHLLDEIPQALVVSQSETLIIALPRKIQVFSIAPATFGELLLESEELPESSLITSIAVSEDRIFAADAGRACIVVFDEQGKVVNEFGQRPKESTVQNDAAETFGGFVMYAQKRFTLAISPTTGLLYATNPGKHRLEVWTQEGNWESPLGWGFASSDLRGFCSCCNPVDFAFLPSGEIVTAEKKIRRVKVMSSRGEFVGLVTSRAATSENSDDIRVATNKHGTIFILDPHASEINSFVPTFSQKL